MSMFRLALREALLIASAGGALLFATAEAAAAPLAALVATDPVPDGYLKASNTDPLDGFANAVAASGDTLVVGAPWENSSAAGVDGDQLDNSVSDAGAVYVFVRSSSGWSQQAYLKASNPGSTDEFGYAVAIDGDTLVVGAFSERSNATGVNGNQADNSLALAGAAYVFVRDGATWTQQAYLKASNTDQGDQFGQTVAISGDTIVVGAYGEDSSATGVDGNQANNSASTAGAAYVFVRSGTTWTQQAYLKASNTAAGDRFGTSVGVSGDTIVVGAYGEDSSATGVDGNQADNSDSQAGAAYVFVRNGETWTQQAYLKASNTSSSDLYGWDAAVSGDTIIVSTPGEDGAGTGVNGSQTTTGANNSGAAWIYVRNGTSWSQQAHFKSSNSEAGDMFGYRCVIRGDRILVTASEEDSDAVGVGGDEASNLAEESGAAYLFTRTGATWAQSAYLKASNTNVGDVLFGGALAEEFVVLGALAEDSNATGIDGDQLDNTAQSAGAAYVFSLPADPWTNLGLGKTGSAGVPVLDGSGTLEVGASSQLDLTSAAASTTATLVFGIAPLLAPFKGGTLVPVPLLLLPLPTGGGGAFTLPFVMPAGVPSGVELYFQCWVADAGASSGFAASNGLRGLVP